MFPLFHSCSGFSTTHKQLYVKVENIHIYAHIQTCIDYSRVNYKYLCPSEGPKLKQQQQGKQLNSALQFKPKID